MKRTKFIAMLLIALAPAALTSCGGDDDDEGGGGSPKSETSTIVTENGDKLLLTGIGSYTFTYDSEGRCTRIYDGNEYTGFSYDPFKVTSNDDDYGNTSCTFTSNGYLARISGSYSDSEGSASGDVRYSYDGSGHLTKIDSKTSEKYNEDGHTYTYSSTGQVILTWQDGNLVKATSTYTDVEDGESEKETTTYTFQYSDTKNAYNQYTAATIDPASDTENVIEPLFFIGWYGKGTANLPSKVSKTYTTYTGSTATDERNVSYSLNTDGTIAREVYGFSTLSYSYSGSSAGSKALAPMFKRADDVSSAVKKDALNKLFSHGKRHRAAK